MAIHKFITTRKADFHYGLVQIVKIIVPLVTCITLTYCSKSLYLFITKGHHVDVQTILFRMIQSAAFVVPASVYLVQTVNYGSVLFIGACFTILGITTPSLFPETRQQEIAFAVLYGAGISIMFQATVMDASPLFRANIVCSVLMLGLSAIIMVMTQRLVELAIVEFAEQIVIGLLVMLSITCVCPAFFDVLHTRRLQKNEKDATKILDVENSNDLDNSKDEDILKTSLTTRKMHSCTTDAGTQTKPGSTGNLVKSNLKWRVCALLWWATGVYLSILSSRNGELSTNTNMLSLMCILSLFTFGFKIIFTERKSAHTSDSDSDTGYFVLGLLGTGGLILRFYPLFTDAHCYILLFTMGFFHQLKPSEVSHKVHLNCNSFGWVVNQFCVELVFTFGAIAIGYLLACIVYNITVAPVVSSKLFSDVTLSVVSSIMVLLSVQYSMRREQTSSITSVKSDSNDQA